jgi:hypothetical protein
MKRIEFRLSMPGVASWNGRWSGEGKNYVIIKTLSDKAAEHLLCGGKSKAWGHFWSDGWSARVTARIMGTGERRLKSDGFCGYDWMVTNILSHGDTRPAEPVEKMEES